MTYWCQQEQETMTVLHFFTLTQAATLVLLTISCHIQRSNRQGRKQYDRTRNGNESVMEAKIDPFIFIIYDENSILINFLIDWYYISDFVNLAFEETRFLLVITISNIVKY